MPWLGLLATLVGLLLPTPYSPPKLSRRALGELGLAAPGLRGLGVAVPASAAEPLADAVALQSSENYRVIADSTRGVQPVVRPVTAKQLVARLAERQHQAVFLGEHHNSAADHLLQAAVIRELHERRGKAGPVAVGLEAVQRRFQPALDEYVAGAIDEAQLEEVCCLALQTVLIASP